MASYNQATFVGNLTRDPEARNLASGSMVVNFTIAVNGYKEGDVSFIPVVAWEKTAEICAKSLRKASRVLVAGEIKQDNWETEDGQKRSKLFLNARTVQFLDPKGEVSEVDSFGSPVDDDDTLDVSDLPF